MGVSVVDQQHPILDKYVEVTKDLLSLSFPGLTDYELDMAIKWSINKRLVDTPAVIDNNYKHEQTNTTLLQVSDWILSRRPIITSYGVMFTRHGEVPNPLYKMIDGFINDRKKAKKEMFKYPKGSDQFEHFNLLQLLLKINRSH